MQSKFNTQELIDQLAVAVGSGRISEIAGSLRQENQSLDQENQSLGLENQSLRREVRSLARENQGLNYENQNLNFEIAELHQRVTRLSDLYKLVCEENKGLLEELNADMPVQVVNDPTDSYKEEDNVA